MATLPAKDCSEADLLALVADSCEHRELDRRVVTDAGRAAWAWRNVDDEITALLRPMVDDERRRQ